MSILFVLLTFLLILSIMYFRRPEVPVAAMQVAPFQKVSMPIMLKASGFEVPENYSFHPGHTWVHDEGRQNARVGIDAFAGNLFGQVDSIELADLNRWVRQGQKLCTVKHGDQSVDMLSPGRGRADFGQPRSAEEPEPDHGRSLQEWLALRGESAGAGDQREEPVAGTDRPGMDAEQHRPPRRNDAATQPGFGARRRPPHQGLAFSGRCQRAGATGQRNFS